ncbi:hemicentin-2-like isoform X2 [Mya arenaria]|nr:hemicentin-2-like isoform X2 [Mya arenaria]
MYNNLTSSGCYFPTPGWEPNPVLYSYACPSRTRHTLTIKNVTSDVIGVKWRCMTYTPNEASNIVTITLKVPVRSVVLKTPSMASVVVVEKSSPIDFWCEVPRSLPRSTIQWYHDNRTPGETDDDVRLSKPQESTSDNDDLTIKTTSNMQFTPTRYHNGVRVYCTAYNGYGNTLMSDRQTLINVKYSPDGPPVIRGVTLNSNYFAIHSTSQLLTCSIIGGNPLANITWSCYGGTVGILQVSGQNVSRTVTWVVGSKEQPCTCISNQEVVGEQRSSINVKVLYPPDQPRYDVGNTSIIAIGTIRIVKNRAVEITCKSDSNPAPSVWRWRSPLSAVIQAPGKVLSIPNPHLTDAGVYTCEAENTMVPSQGSSVKGKNSSSVNIEVLYPPSTPVFHWQNETGAILPDNTVVVVKGDYFTIICDSDSKPGPPAYSWTNKQWTVTAITDAQKTCMVSNTLNPSGYKEESGSNTATVKIETLEPPGEPTFSYIDCQNKQVTFVEDIKVKLGIDVSVTCSSTGKPQPSFQWSSHQSNSPKTFFLQGVTRQHNGSYTCTARNTMNTTFTGLRAGTKSAAFNLNVLYPPSVGLIERLVLLEGGNLTVNCPVQSGNPVISTIKWTRREGIITTSTTKVLKLVAVQRHQSDYYRCTATNSMVPSGCPPEDGSDFSETYIDVQYKASIESFRESSNPADVVTLNQGDPLNITCTVDSNPGSFISIKNSGHVLNTTQTGRSISYSEGKSSCETNMGVYNCLGRNDHNSGYVNKTLTILIRCGPRVPQTVTLIKNVTSDTNVSATLSFTVVAYPVNVQYVWKKIESETSLRTLVNDSKVTIVKSEDGLQSNITIGNVQESDFGEYSVTATNTIDSTYEHFYLVPQAKPETPKRLTFSEITVSSVVLSWVPGFNGGLPQRFVIRYKRKTNARIEFLKEIDDIGVYNETIDDLSVETEYEANIHAVNSIGSSGSISIFFTTLPKEEPLHETSVGALVGGTVGGIIAIAAIVIAIVLFLKRKYTLDCTCSFNMSLAKRKDLNPETNTEQRIDTHDAANSGYSSAYEEVSLSKDHSVYDALYNGDNADNRPNSHMYTHLDASNSQLRVYYENVNKEDPVYNNMALKNRVQTVL